MTTPGPGSGCLAENPSAEAGRAQGRLAVVPGSGPFDTHKHILAVCVDELRPRLE